MIKNTLCPICEGGVTSFRHLAAEESLLRCESCGHCCFENFPGEEVLADYYQTKYSDQHSQLEIQQKNVDYYRTHLHELLSFAKTKDVKLLDFGSSYPVLLVESLKSNSILPIGVEYDENARRFGISQGVKMIHPRELHLIDDQSIDIIRLSHVLEHDLNPKKTLSDLVSKLKPDGILYITQPNFPQIDLSKHQDLLFDVMYPEHLHFFTPASLFLLTTGGGLKTIKFHTHTNDEARDSDLDIHLLRYQLKPFEQKLLSVGDQFFGHENNYPVYRGKNSYYVGSRN